jgi:aerobic-type carbon monoxide dehydrogenase small subunit (CoxS/CutS family)
VAVRLEVDGVEVEVADDAASLLEVLRDRLGRKGPKDGCSPQGQCGCCTVLVDGSPRVACVTPARRVAGRRVTTIDGLPDAIRRRWADAFVAAGASQCGFCTPGIIVRLAAAAHGGPVPADQASRALLAHLCRCTGWRTILDAAARLPGPDPGRDLRAAGLRATLEGGAVQRVGPDVALGRGGFADDGAPPGALVAVADGRGGWAVGETVTEARAAARTVQGRRSGTRIRHPIEVPPGEWSLTLQTTWVEPAYVELDASWCHPGGEPASPLANGGAFGAKTASAAPAAARLLADRYQRPVRVLLSREDAVRLGPKRPPIAAGVRADGTGVMRVARTPGIAAAVASAAPGLAVEEVAVAGPPTSASCRAAGWAEAAVLVAAAERVSARHPLDGPVTVASPAGARASARVALGADGLPATVAVTVACGDPLDEVVLRSYAVGAAHMAMGWVRTEAIAVDDDGHPQDLTIRSFGVLRPAETPPVTVTIEPSGGPPVNGSDAVFAAVAAATWSALGCPPQWPSARGSAS